VRGPSLEARVSEILKRSRLPFESKAAVGGVQADFVVETPDGHRHAIEAKPWAPTEANVKRARSYANQMAAAADVQRAYVVLPQLKKDLPERGVLSPAGLEALLAGASAQGRPESAARPGGLPRADRPIVFAAMPFARDYDDVFFVAIAGAAKKVKAVAKRVDQEAYEGDIVAKIKERLSTARAVIVDLSDSRPNVMYEMGFAQAVNRPVIPICSSPASDLPFDVRNLNILHYEKGQTSALVAPLGKRLKAALA
jgi:hypothetical protein